MTPTAEKADSPVSEKGDSDNVKYDQTSVDDSNHGISDVDLANYYEEKAGSLVVDPEYVWMLLSATSNFQLVNIGRRKLNSGRKLRHD